MPVTITLPTNPHNIGDTGHTTDHNTIVTALSTIANGVAAQLTPTAVKTSAYNAVVGDFVPVNVTSASVTVTLPTAPADKSVIGVKLVATASSHTVTVAAGGTDVFDISGTSTVSLSTVSQAVYLQYAASPAIWYMIANFVSPSAGGGITPPAGDIGGTTGSPTVAKLQGTTLASPPGGTTQFLRGDGNWAVPAAASSGYNVTPSGDTTGATDKSAVNTITSVAGGVAVLAPGTYYFNTPLAMAAGSALIGKSPGSTTIKYNTTGTAWSGAALITITGHDLCYIGGLTIAGNSTTYSSNPAADGIDIKNSNSTVIRDVSMNYINGWCVYVESNATSDSFNTVLDNLHTFSAAKGVLMNGTASSDHNQNTTMVNCNIDQCQSSDAVQITDVHDVEIVDLKATCTAGTGNCIHIAGISAGIFIDGVDLGPNSFTSAGILIEQSASNNPNQITIENGIVEGCTPNINITNGTDIILRDLIIYHGQSNGISISGAASDIEIVGCRFDGDGQTAGTNYDISSSTSGNVWIHHNYFKTPQGSSSGQVTCAVNPGSTGFVIVDSNWIAGAQLFSPNFPKRATNNKGYNPVGHISSPSVPATTVALTNPQGGDAWINITAGSSTCTVAVGGTTAFTLGSGGSGSVFLPWQQTITLTYTSTPSWVWFIN